VAAEAEARSVAAAEGSCCWRSCGAAPSPSDRITWARTTTGGFDRSATIVVEGSKAEPTDLVAGSPPGITAHMIAVRSAAHSEERKKRWLIRGIAADIASWAPFGHLNAGGSGRDCIISRPAATTGRANRRGDAPGRARTGLHLSSAADKSPAVPARRRWWTRPCPDITTVRWRRVASSLHGRPRTSERGSCVGRPGSPGRCDDRGRQSRSALSSPPAAARNRRR